MDEYIVSARKYRPMSFDTVVGQTALTTTLKNAVRSGKLAHAYLFCGPRGVGKTTCARIFAKAINCQNPTAEGEACNHCPSCTAFNEQRSYSIFELDAASNNSVENIKTLMEQTRIPPQVGKYKVFIIDEVHMLSTAAFNAFLKTLEEPPAHVIFILATTEKHKILPTIISRCQIYDFDRMSVSDITDHLRKVAEKEGINVEDEALNLMAEKADGGMRDALSLFDQAAAFCQGDITAAKVAQNLNLLDTENYFRLTDMALDNQVAEMMVLVNSILARGFDGGRLVNGLASHLRNILMAKDEKTLPLLKTSSKKTEQYRQQAKRCPLPFLYSALKLTNNCDVNYRQSSNKRLLTELTLIEIAQLTQPDDKDTPVAGRRPKRLKSLFDRLITDTKQPMAAIQVTAASTDTKNNAATALTTSDNGQPSTLNLPGSSLSTPNSPVGHVRSPEQEPSTDKRTKLTSIGTSFNKMRSTDTGSAAVTARKTDTAPDNVAFTNDDLHRAWLTMCNNMPQELRGVAARMRNLIPAITTLPTVEVTVDNRSLLGSMTELRQRITTYLARSLHNNTITLDIKLSDVATTAHFMSRDETLTTMRNDFPAVDLLCQLLDMEIA